jgi:hypothetical protein
MNPHDELYQTLQPTASHPMRRSLLRSEARRKRDTLGVPRASRPMTPLAMRRQGDP